MKETNCDDILMAMMAAADGEETGIHPEQVEAHIAVCENCRNELVQAEAMAGMLQNYVRREEKADLWPAIGTRIEVKRSVWSNWPLFAGLALAMVLYRLAEMLPANNPGYLLKIAPILAAAALFIILRENPFKINTELIPER